MRIRNKRNVAIETQVLINYNKSQRYIAEEYISKQIFIVVIYRIRIKTIFQSAEL